MNAVCRFCGDPVDADSRLTWYRMEGWARPGKAGGSDVALRERAQPGEFAHDMCISREQQGVAALQESLL